MLKSDDPPDTVLEKCGDHCLNSQTACRGFAFRPGKWTSSRWSESYCVLTKGLNFEAILIENDVPDQYFNQICLKSPKYGDLCRNMTYAVTTYPGLNLRSNDSIIVQANDRVECMDRCLSETSFGCKSAVFDKKRVCRLYRRTGGTFFRSDGTFYMENECNKGLSRCDGYTHFIKEKSARLIDGRVLKRISDASLMDCLEICRDDYGNLNFNCKSFEYDARTKQCYLSEETSRAVKTVSSADDFYELQCIEGAVPPASAKQGVSYLYGRESSYYTESIPFQRYRNSRLEGTENKRYRNIELGRCLDECLHARCLSVVYSSRTQECKLYMENQRTQRILYEPYTDYYENIADSSGSSSSSGSGSSYRPSSYYDQYPGAYRPSSSSSGRETGGRRGRCDPGTGDTFRQVRSRTRLRQQFIRRARTVSSLFECEQECKQERNFKCLSFNYIVGFSPTSEQNCELSDQNSYDLDLDKPAFYSQSDRFDFYERTADVNSPLNDNCFDVSQTCNQDGMEFTLRTPEGFNGRIYTHNNYARSGCYVRGSRGNTHTLRIPSIGGYPDCGTTQYADTMTNIVVVQFSEDIQTSMDMKYNLTCTVRGPGSAVVTSGYIGAGSGQPVPIEYLPAEHTLDSRVRLVIKYQERPTTTIAVGDPLQFKLETQEGENLLRDIFATNVIAKDPYSERSVELIDSRGCPVDPYVFPALGLSRSSDGLETSFNAFKIPESNFLVFEATVRSCRSGCRPAVCDGPSGQDQGGRGRDNSFGRRRRDENSQPDEENEEKDNVKITEMFRVYETRASIPEDQIQKEPYTNAQVCLGSGSVNGLIGGLVVFAALTGLLALSTLYFYRRYREYSRKGEHNLNGVVNFNNALQDRLQKDGKTGSQERYLPPWSTSNAEVGGPEVRWQAGPE